MFALPGRFGRLMIAPLVVGTVMAGGALAQSGGPQNQALMQMSHEAAGVLNDAGMAAMALNQGDKAGALKDIVKAMTKRDELALTARSHNLTKIVPIYTEMDQSTQLDTMLAKRNNGQTTPPAKQPVTIGAVKDQYTFVGVDLDKAKSRLMAADVAIRNNQLQVAKDKLNAIGDDLVVAKVTGDAPLLAIRENLGLAHVAAAQGHKREATAALQQASGELVAYAQMGGAPHGNDARQLKTSIDQMLSSNGQKQTMSADQIGMWWETVNGWMQQPGA